ncbi:MAG: hypothetical protein K0Q47_156 [Sedimentibacter sp.]|jgi:uncharacterized protein involved in type VI secretion and phage assembly|nr:hypothetical protein [Sedimentibacter sp.]
MDVLDVFGKFESQDDNKFFGKFRAVVSKIDDPEKLGRIKVTCPDIYGDDESPWAWPCFPIGGSLEIGYFGIPEKGAGVWVEFEQGHTTNPIWSGCWYTKPKNKNEVPKEAKDKYGDTQVIKTKTGHIIEISDKKGDEYIHLYNGKTKSSVKIEKDITFHSEGNVIIEVPNGHVDVR